MKNNIFKRFRNHFLLFLFKNTKLTTFYSSQHSTLCKFDEGFSFLDRRLFSFDLLLTVSFLSLAFSFSSFTLSRSPSNRSCFSSMSFAFHTSPPVVLTEDLPVASLAVALKVAGKLSLSHSSLTPPNCSFGLFGLDFKVEDDFEWI